MRQAPFSTAVAFVLTILAAPAAAEIYKCVDAAGHVTYSNVVQKGCTKLELEPLSTIPGQRKSTAATASPSSFPKVEAETQKKRDGERRKILEDELATEQRSLDGARKDLAEQEAVRSGDERNYQKYLDRVQSYKDKVALHERNVASLKRELENLR